MLILILGILLVIALVAASVWAVLRSKSKNSLDEIQHLANMAAALAETAVLYRQLGMNQEADEAWADAERLNKIVWDVINNANKGG
jgi:hypothetical protein